MDAAGDARPLGLPRAATRHEPPRPELTAVALEMRDRCERCGAALRHGDEAHVCSFECTFCPRCAAELRAVCPNCGGELVRRPRRASPSGAS